MNYRTVKLPSAFIDEVEKYANNEYRSITQQLMYWADIGKKFAASHIGNYEDNDDEELGKLAIKRYNEEKHLAIKMSLDEL